MDHISFLERGRLEFPGGDLVTFLFLGYVVNPAGRGGRGAISGCANRLILVHQTVKNWPRADFHLFDLVDALVHLRDANGYSQMEVARATGKVESKVSHLRDELLAREDYTALAETHTLAEEWHLDFNRRLRRGICGSHSRRVTWAGAVGAGAFPCRRRSRASRHSFMVPRRCS